MHMPSGGKDKGTGRYGRQRGMGRLRTTNRKDVGRLGDWSNHAEDDAFLDRHGNNQSSQHGGERLVSQFNRLVALRSKAPRRGEPAEVSGIRPGSIQVRFPDGRESIAALRRALEKRVVGMSNTLAVGDQVRVEQVRDEANAQSEWVIVAVEPRRNQIARADSHNRSLEHVLAANLDVLVAVSSVHDPDFKHGFVDRALLLAAVNSITAIVVVSKRDLGDPRE
ncbi:MAG: GTPase RsgA, partial [Planctomycetota bacterium]